MNNFLFSCAQLFIVMILISISVLGLSFATSTANL